MSFRIPHLRADEFDLRGRGMCGRESGECFDDFHVSALGCVLVAQRGAGCGVAEWGHEFGEGCAGLCGKDGAAVADTVPAQVRSTGGLACSVERLVQRRRGKVGAVSGGDQQPVATVLACLVRCS